MRLRPSPGKPKFDTLSLVVHHTETDALLTIIIRSRFGSRCKRLEMDAVALVTSAAAVAAQEAGAKGFALGNTVRNAVRQVTSFPI